MLTAREADRKAMRAFWRGTFIGLILGAGIAGWAQAESISISGTTVSIAPSDDPGIAAIVTMENVSLNSAADNGTYDLAMHGMSVQIEFVWEVGIFGEDQITVIPPDGFVCLPASCRTTAMEGFSTEILLIEWQGM